MTDDFDTPRCDKCGCKITTGLMAVFCPKGADCEFYPEEPELQEFIEELRPSANALALRG